MASEVGYFRRGRDLKMSLMGKIRDLDNMTQSTGAGRMVSRSALESFGFQYHRGVNQGFLGLSQTRLGKAYTGAVTHGQSGLAAAGRSAGRAAAQGGVRGTAKAIGSTALRGLPLLATGFLAYQGFQKGGIMGDARGIGESVLGTAIFNTGAAALGSAFTGATLGAATIGAAAYGYYRFGEAVRGRGKRLREIEMGGPVVDPFGTGATMRQRSLAALQNTHINGRIAMGNEASLMHVRMELGRGRRMF